MNNNTTPEFKPTYLMIKQHALTKKLYFCKTTKDHDGMLNYSGSGNIWLNHINKHGKEYVETIWYCLYYDKDTLEEFALMFSEQQNITESESWANIIPENGLTGFPAGLVFSEEHVLNLQKAKKGKTWEEIYGIEGAALKRSQNSAPRGPMVESRKKNISAAKKGMPSPHNWDEQTRQKVSDTLTGIKRTDETKEKMRNNSKIQKICPHCGLIGSGMSMQRWHFNHCKFKGINV